MIGLFVVAIAAPRVAAAEPDDIIRVIGHGLTRTAPDRAVITFSVRGEGRTSDDAARVLTQVRERTDAVLAGRAEVRTGRLSIEEARAKACDGSEDDATTRLSTGDCAITGYVATLGMTARVRSVTDAGTLLSLVGRAGGVNPRVEDFALADPGAAQRVATAAAMVDARAQAEAIANAAGKGLGRLRSVEDQRARSSEGGAEDIVVTATRAPPVVSPPPVTIALSPQLIDTSADLIVTYEIAPPR